MKALLFLALMFYGIIGQAEELKVLKVKGRKAIVKIPKGMEISKGDMLNVGGDSEKSGGGMASTGTWTRNNSLGVAFTFTSQSSKVASVDAGTSTVISLNATYGMNWGSFEAGPELLYSSSKTEVSNVTVESSTMGLGGFFDWNFIPNKPGTFMSPSAGVEAGYLSSTSGDVTSSGFSFGVNGKVKLFPWNDSFAIVPSLEYTMVSLDTEGIKTDMTGFGLSVGAIGYF